MSMTFITIYFNQFNLLYFKCIFIPIIGSLKYFEYYFIKFYYDRKVYLYKSLNKYFICVYIIYGYLVIDP